MRPNAARFPKPYKERGNIAYKAAAVCIISIEAKTIIEFAITCALPDGRASALMLTVEWQKPDRQGGRISSRSIASDYKTHDSPLQNAKSIARVMRFAKRSVDEVDAIFHVGPHKFLENRNDSEEFP